MNFPILEYSILHICASFLQWLRCCYLQLKDVGMAVIGLLYCCLIIHSSLLQAQTPSPQGSQFEINEYLLNDQTRFRIATSSNGDAVIVWTRFNTSGNNSEIFAQRYNSNREAVGIAFQVNTTTTDEQILPDVAMDSTGNFVIVWRGEDGNSGGIFLQRYDQNGVKQGVEILVNDYTNSLQSFPKVAMDKDGNYVVTWRSFGQDGFSSGVIARRFNSAGVKQGTEFIVNTNVQNSQDNPDIAMDEDGNFVIVWEDTFGAIGNGNIRARRFNNSGTALDSEFQVNTYSSNLQSVPCIAMSSDGDFTIAWQSFGQDGDQAGIYAQSYNADGTVKGTETQVHTTITENQINPAISYSKTTKKFVIVWESQIVVVPDPRSPDLEVSVFGQYFDESGNKQGDEFLIDRETKKVGANPDVAIHANNEFTVTWEKTNPNATNFDNGYGQPFRIATTDVPTVSEWGLLNLALLLMIGGVLSLLEGKVKIGGAL